MRSTHTISFCYGHVIENNIPNGRVRKMATPSRNPIRLSDEDKQELAESSQQAKENAHCPYSKFRVGSAVLVRFKNGEKKIFKGEKKNPIYIIYIYIH